MEIEEEFISGFRRTHERGVENRIGCEYTRQEDSSKADLADWCMKDGGTQAPVRSSTGQRAGAVK